MSELTAEYSDGSGVTFSETRTNNQKLYYEIGIEIKINFASF